MYSQPPISSSNDDDVNTKGEDAYKSVEQQLRGIRTVAELRGLVAANKDAPNDGPRSFSLTRVLGLSPDDSEDDLRITRSLAEEHGALLLRNFVPCAEEQTKLAALPLKHVLSDRKNSIFLGNDHGAAAAGGSRRRSSKEMERVKSELRISGRVLLQTNFGPQLTEEFRNHSSRDGLSQENHRIEKKSGESHEDGSPSAKCAKTDDGDAARSTFLEQKSFPLAKLRYVNLGEWNYDWGNRRYEKVAGAAVLDSLLVDLATLAMRTARQKYCNDETPASSSQEKDAKSPDFNMAICNLYHLSRASDRLGGHKDDVESDLDQPLVTISLGAPGVFLLGGYSRSVKPEAILLRSGDCLVLGGKSRHYYHGIPTVLHHDFHEVVPDEQPGAAVVDGKNHVSTLLESLALPAYDVAFASDILRTVRINMSIRQV